MLNKISWSFIQKDFLVWSPRQDTHSFHSLIFMVDKTFFLFFDKFIFWGGRSRVTRMRMNVCVQCVGEFLQDVRWNTIISGQKASQKQKKSLKKNAMLLRRTEIWDRGARKRRLLLLCAPQSQSSARCANINFFFFAVSIFFLWLAPRNLPGKGGSSRSLKY